MLHGWACLCNIPGSASETSKSSRYNQALMPVVLVVDDQPFIGVAVKGLLAADPGIQLHTCHEPREAKTLAARLQPAVILIDLVMPDVDGLTLIGLLRGDPDTSGIPLIAMSGNTDDKSRQEALAAGASDFVVKLPPRDELIATIRRHAAADPAADGLARVEAVTVPPAEPQAPQSAEDQTLDRQAVAALRDMSPDREFVTSLIDLFVREAAAQVEELRDAVARADGEAMRSLAHRLRGSSNTIGARKLAALSGQLENHARRNRGSAVGPVLVAEIADEFARVRGALALERSEGGAP